jgi:hypothetical protein
MNGMRSNAQRVLRRFALAMGIGALLALLAALYRLLTSLTRRLKRCSPSEGEKEGATPIASRSKTTTTTRTTKPFAAFISHMKAEASMEARFVQAELEALLSRRVFLDSDDLRDLSQLTQHVRESEVLILVQSKSVLTRPYCLIELMAAFEENVPIVGLCLERHSFPYDFAASSSFLTHLDTALSTSNPGAEELLVEHGIDMVGAAHELSSRLPNIISVRLDTCASKTILKATISDLVSAMAGARPAPLLRQSTRDEWLAQRDAARKRGSLRSITAHGHPRGETDLTRRPSAESAVPLHAPVRAKKELAAPKVCTELRTADQLPPLGPGMIIFITGGFRLGPGCPVEPSCCYAASIHLILAHLDIAHHTFVLDLQDKDVYREWLNPLIGKPAENNITSPIAYIGTVPPGSPNW